MAQWVEPIIVAVTCGGFVVVPYALFRRPRKARSLLRIRLENIELRLLKLQLAGNFSADVGRLLVRVRAIQERPSSAATAPANAAVSLSSQSLAVLGIAEAYDTALRGFRHGAWPRRSSTGGSKPWPSAVSLVSCPRAGGCTCPGGCPLRPMAASAANLPQDVPVGSPCPPPQATMSPAQSRTSTPPDSVARAYAGLGRRKKMPV